MIHLDTRRAAGERGSHRIRDRLLLERVRIDTERNFLDVLDKIHEISINAVDPTHIFTLSQVYEGLLQEMMREIPAFTWGSRTSG